MSSLSSWNPSIKLELKGRTRHIVFSVLEPRLHITLSNSSHTTPQDTFMHSMTLSRESRHPQDAFICILWHILLYIESTKTIDIGRNFSYFLNLQYESRRLSSYLFKVNIGRTVVQFEDGRTDGRNSFSSLMSNDETRRHRKISVVCSADVELRTDDCQPCSCHWPFTLFPRITRPLAMSGVQQARIQLLLCQSVPWP